ncbi:branched-chain amino acid ABC transporter permease [Geminicoccaceae bacterium 1502E]|nr:branched-chain amino acid ABC transporter permease [Geminicoccaceae bacterium 1502E]
MTRSLTPRSDEAEGRALGLPAVRLGGAAAGALVYVVVLPLLLADHPYWLNVLTNASILSFASLGVWVTFAIGRINIAQGAFAMIGGYTTAILSTRYGVPFWLCLPASGLVAAGLGALIGIPILRLRGVYFAMITLSLTEAVRLAFLNGGELTNGASGIVNIPRPAGIDTPLAFYLLSAALLIAGLLAVWRLSTCRLGWIFHALRQNEELASSIGIDIARYRVIAFAFACAMGGIAGSFFAVFHQNIYPASYTMQDSINAMLYCFLGGLDFVLGPVVGAFLLVIAFELLGDIQRYQALLYGVLMISVMLFLPNGILSLRWPGRER